MPSHTVSNWLEDIDTTVAEQVWRWVSNLVRDLDAVALAVLPRHDRATMRVIS